MGDPSNLRESFLESIVQDAPIAIIAVDKASRVCLMNPRGCNYLGVSVQEVKNAVGKPVAGYLAKFGASTAPIIQNLKASCFSFDLPEVKLGTRYLNIRCRPMEDGALLTLLNINNLKEKEGQAVNALLEGQEQERKRFAQEIHDGIGPLLSTLKLSLQNLQTNFSNPTKVEENQLEFGRLTDLIDAITIDIRSISHALLPYALVDFGLENALANLCELVQRQSKIKVDCFVSKKKNRLSPTIELGLYRIAQELLNNALKYAGASTIAVQVIRHTSTVVLMVEDDGIGFDTSDPKNKQQGIGFKNVMARVESLNGSFSIESAVGDGVLATIEIPLKLATNGA